ncbi:MAG: pilus assembly protein FimV [Oceanicoccus sp.]|jgi:pilus assembly protein FimV
MLRKLAIAIAASGAMMSATNVLALGMGDIELESALNQPLDARIKLLKASELENWEMKPNLASTEEFEKSGVEHVFFLNNLQFAIERSGDDVFVHVTSNQAVVEPFLNFLVQVDWPNGRLLREYTLLLDPPVFNEEPPVPVKPVQSEDYTEDEFVADSMALPGTAPAQSVAPKSVAAPVEKMVQKVPAPQSKPEPSVYKVRANDTLWEVAIRTRANRSISPQQAMLAIQDLNPSAFINGNINRLKKNQVLRVPDEQQMLSRSFDDAVSEVAVQNQVIAKRKAQLDATRKDAAIQRDNKLSGAQLKLLAGGEATTDNERSASGKVASKTAGDQSKLEKDLSITLENLDKTTRENQELRSRLDSLEEQINTLQRLINLKDEQMVALQSGMAGKPVKAIKNDLALPTETAKPAQDLNFADAATKQDAEKAEAAKKAAADKKLEAAKLALSAPVEEDFDLVAFVMENPPILGAGLGALLLALLGINYGRKRKETQQEAGNEVSKFDSQDPLDDVDLGDDFKDDFSINGQDADLELDGFNEGELSDFDDINADAGLATDVDDGSQSEDVLGEVDVYMAYNRLEPARALLEKTIETQPARMDLRLKMVELLSLMDDQGAISEHVEFINSNGSDDDKSLVAQFQSGDMTEEVNEDFAMNFSLDDESPLKAASSSLDDFDSMDLSLNDEPSDLDFDLDGLELNDSDSLDTDLDFGASLDLEGSLDTDLESPNDLDLALDFNTSNDDEPDLDITLDESDDSNSMDFDLSDFESSADEEIDLDDINEPVALDLDPELDALSLDSTDDGLDFDLSELQTSNDTNEDLSFELNEESDDNVLDFELTDADSADIPQLSTNDELEGLSFEETDENEEITLDLNSEVESDGLELGDLDGADDFEFSSLELDASDESLPEFEEGLSFDEDEMELPELTDEFSSDLDSELDALAADDIDLPTLETDTADLHELPDLDEDFDLSITAPEDELEAIEDVVAEYKEELPSLSDAKEADDFPPLGDLDDIDLDNLDNDLDFLSGTDESETKLDLARAYIDMEDQDGAREILQEVLEDGTDEQKQEATKLMDSLV